MERKVQTIQMKHLHNNSKVTVVTNGKVANSMVNGIKFVCPAGKDPHRKKGVALINKQLTLPRLFNITHCNYTVMFSCTEVSNEQLSSNKVAQLMAAF